MNKQIPAEYMKQQALDFINKKYGELKYYSDEDLLDEYVHLIQTEDYWQKHSASSGATLGLYLVDMPEFSQLLKDMKAAIIMRMEANKDA